MSARWLLSGLRTGGVLFAVLAYLILVGLPSRLGDVTVPALAALAVGLFNLAWQRRGAHPSLVELLIKGVVGGVTLSTLVALLMGISAALIAGGARVQTVLDKMTPPAVAAWFGVPPIAITRGELEAAAVLRTWLALVAAGPLSGLLAFGWQHRQALRQAGGEALRRWLVRLLPFALLGLVLALGDPAVTIGGSQKGTLRLLAAMISIVAGLVAWRAARSSREQALLGGLLLAGLAILPFTLDQFQNAVMGIVFIFVMMGLGLNIVVGYAGLLDLGYVAFFAIGAYAYAFLSAPFSSPWFSQQLAQWGVQTDQPLLSFWQAIPPIMVLAAIGGVLLGTPVLRLRGDYLAIVTLGFGEIIRLFMLNLADLTNGPRGLLNVAPPTVFGYDLGNPRDIFILALLGSGVIAFAALRLERSRLGRAWVAIREDEEAAQAMGVPLVRAKLLAFAIGATFAGLAGQLYAARQVNIFPDNFTLFVSIDALALIIVGGMGSIPGVVLGALALKGLPEVLRGVDEYRIVAFAALLVIMMIARPEGILPAQRTKAELGARAESQPGV
jgi:branched-chain amino acid transport system permease protein